MPHHSAGRQALRQDLLHLTKGINRQAGFRLSTIGPTEVLNPALDAGEIGRLFRSKQRVLIRDLLMSQAAEMLHSALAQTKWDVALIDGSPRLVSSDQMAVMPEIERKRLMQTVLGEARSSFQFMYNSYPMVTAYREKRAPGTPLHDMVEIINGAVQDLVTTVTGDSRIQRADAQATLYAPGHFLTRHNDTDKSGRLYAYVMGFTKAWRAEWGGQLQFLHDNGEVDESYLPGFNSLTLFSVPQLHQVTYVPVFAPIGRFAITGWFYDRT